MSDAFGDVSNHQAQLHWQGDAAAKTFLTRKALDYYLLMFPEGVMERMVMGTNQSLETRNKPLVSCKELSLWLGLRLTMIVDHRSGPLGVYWETDESHQHDEETVYQPSDFRRRFGMSKNRFEDINSPFRLEIRQLAHMGAENYDPWHQVRKLIAGFNSSRVKLVTPGRFLCVDESMVFWKGLELTFSLKGLPHSSKQPRKPANEGVEFKTAACAQTGIMLGLDLLEGAAKQETKKYRAEVENAGTAYVLRLCEAWFGSQRIVVADSAFSSVSTLQHCARRGLGFMGIVKQASKKFPKRFLKAWCDPRTEATRGSHMVLTSHYMHPDQPPNTPPQQDAYPVLARRKAKDGRFQRVDYACG